MKPRSVNNSGSILDVHVAVVNLTRAAERRERMGPEFDRAGIAPVYFPAIDAREPDNRARLDQMPDHGPWGAVALHDKACTASHLALLRAFLERDESYCLVLEDDVFLSPEISEWLADLSWWPDDAEMVKLERWRDDKLLLVMDRKARTHLGRSIARLHSRHSGTAGYMVSRKGAEKIVETQVVNMPIDHLLFNINISPTARSLTTYQVFPALVVQGNDPEPAAGSTRAQTGKPAENRHLKKLRRGWAEIKVVPELAARCLVGGAVARKVAFEARMMEGTA